MDEKDTKVKSTDPQDRLELWADLVKIASKKLPVNSKTEFIELCLDVYRNGYDEEFKNDFFVSETYAAPRWKKIINEAASGNDGVFIKYVRERDGGFFRGMWRKVNKWDYIKEMNREASGLATRIENYNYNKETAEKRWKNLELPIFDVKQLPPNA